MTMPDPVPCPQCAHALKAPARFCVMCGMRLPADVSHALEAFRPHMPPYVPIPAELMRTRDREQPEEVVFPQPGARKWREALPGITAPTEAMEAGMCCACGASTPAGGMVTYAYDVEYRDGARMPNYRILEPDYTPGSISLTYLRDSHDRAKLDAEAKANGFWTGLTGGAAWGGMDIRVTDVHVRPCPACGEQDAFGLADAAAPHADFIRVRR